MTNKDHSRSFNDRHISSMNSACSALLAPIHSRQCYLRTATLSSGEATCSYSIIRGGFNEGLNWRDGAGMREL